MTDELPLSVWATGQQPSRQQRQGRYLPESNAHPARMLPEVARHAIRAYTSPGDLVLDPMCGIGTTQVEGTHLGRDVIGVEYESRWAQVAARNIEFARTQGATGNATVVAGDSTRLSSVLDVGLHGRVALVLTSPPYGPSVHGQARASKGSDIRPIEKWDCRYSNDPGNLAHQSTSHLLDGFTAILEACLPFLRVGAILAITARPWRRDGMLMDLPAAIGEVAEQVGYVPLERNVALLAALGTGELIPRATFFQMQQVRTARRRGRPLRIIAHEDLMVFRKP